MSAALNLLGMVPVMTADQFAEWPGDGTGRAFQLIDGEPVAMAPTSPTHGAILSVLDRRLGNHLERIDSPCTTIVAPGTQPRAGAADNVRIPDLAVTCGALERRFVNDPVVIVEILSPSNFRETYEAIRAYLSLPSLREVVVISSERIAADVLRRDADGAWPPNAAAVGPDDDLAIETFGFRCPLRALYPAGFA
jgi:Uma2 family endonuclease